MGRVSRYKKAARDDPFAPKRAEKVDLTINHEPGRKDLKDDGGGMTRSMKAVVKAQERARKHEEMQRYKSLVEKGKAKASDKPAFQFVSEAQRSAALEFQPEVAKPAAPKEFESMKEDETYHQFSRRLRDESRELMKKRIVADSHTVEKRREYYERKKEQKRRKKAGVDSDEEKDREEGKISDFSKLEKAKPKFGEQAQAPPKFSSLPRHSAKVDMAIAKRVSESGTSGPLTAFKEKKKAAQVARLADFDRSYMTNADGSAPSTVVRTTVQTAEQKKAMEELRDRVQEQYRQLKARRLALNQAAAAAQQPTQKTRKKKVPQLSFTEEDMERSQAMRPESRRGMKKAKKQERWLRH